MTQVTKEAMAVSSAVEVVKVTLALATGALVFSAELLTDDVHIAAVAKCFLVSSWASLGISIVAGALACLRVPVMIHEGRANIHDRWFEPPGKVHHLAFMVGVLSLGVAMVLILIIK